MTQLELEVVDGRAFVDGSPLDVRPGEEPAAALIAHAQERARTHGVVLAHLRDGGGVDTWVNVAPDGSITPAPEPTIEQEPNRPESAPPQALSAWSTHDERTGTRTRLGERASLPVGTPSRRALLVGAGAVGALAFGGAVWAITGSSDDEKTAQRPTATASSVPLPNGQNPPAGWSENAAWQIENVADPKPQIDVRDGRFAVLTEPPGSGAVAVTVATSRDGKVAWSKALPVGEVVTDGPFIVRRSGADVVLAATTARLVGWNLRTGRQVADHKLPSKAEGVGFGLLGPWIAGGGKRYYGLTSSGLAPFDIPDKASCFGTFDDRMLVVDGSAQVWKLESGKPKPKPTKLEGPKDMAPGGVVMVTEDTIVTSWRSWRNVTLRAYDLKNLKPRWTTATQPDWDAGVGTSRIAPSRAWATVGNRHVDLTNGRVSVIAAKWAPVTISDDFAWGDDGTYILACDRRGKLVSGRPEHPSTETVTVSAGDGANALVTSAAYGTPTLYLLKKV